MCVPRLSPASNPFRVYAGACARACALSPHCIPCFCGLCLLVSLPSWRQPQLAGLTISCPFRPTVIFPRGPLVSSRPCEGGLGVGLWGVCVPTFLSVHVTHPSSAPKGTLEGDGLPAKAPGDARRSQHGGQGICHVSVIGPLLVTKVGRVVCRLV